jgi:hypothetical protein
MVMAAHHGPMFAIALIATQQVTRRALTGAHACDPVLLEPSMPRRRLRRRQATGDLRNAPPKPGVRTSRIGWNGDVRST